MISNEEPRTNFRSSHQGVVASRTWHLIILIVRGNVETNRGPFVTWLAHREDASDMPRISGERERNWLFSPGRLYVRVGPNIAPSPLCPSRVRFWTWLTIVTTPPLRVAHRAATNLWGRGSRSELIAAQLPGPRLPSCARPFSVNLT